MKASSLLLVVFFSFWTTSELRTLCLGSCVITTNLQDIQNVFSELRDIVQAQDENTDVRILRNNEYLQDTKSSHGCCLLLHLVTLYTDKVFNKYQTSDHHVARMISTLANSFLIIKKDLEIWYANMTCHRGKEVTEKYKQIQSNFEKLEPQAAAVKALGELDILLRWMEEMKKRKWNTSGQAHSVLSSMET